jgi:hypothetical protein
LSSLQDIDNTVLFTYTSFSSYYQGLDRIMSTSSIPSSVGLDAEIQSRYHVYRLWPKTHSGCPLVRKPRVGLPAVMTSSYLPPAPVLHSSLRSTSTRYPISSTSLLFASIIVRQHKLDPRGTRVHVELPDIQYLANKTNLYEQPVPNPKKHKGHCP